MTFKEFAEKHNLELYRKRIPKRTDREATEWDIYARHYEFDIIQIDACGGGWREDYIRSGEYSQGSAVMGSPTLEDILQSLRCDVSNMPCDFEDWAGDFGYDTDSRRAYSMYEECYNTYGQLEDNLGREVFQEFMRCEEE